MSDDVLILETTKGPVTIAFRPDLAPGAAILGAA